MEQVTREYETWAVNFVKSSSEHIDKDTAPGVIGEALIPLKAGVNKQCQRMMARTEAKEAVLALRFELRPRFICLQAVAKMLRVTEYDEEIKEALAVFELLDGPKLGAVPAPIPPRSLPGYRRGGMGTSTPTTDFAYPRFT